MINQIQGIKGFIEHKLGDLPSVLVIDKDVNGVEIANGDRASATLTVNKKRCQIILTSAYVDAPLGRITMTDLDTLQVVSGAKLDATWDAVNKHIRTARDDAMLQEATPRLEQVREAPLEPASEPIPDRVPHLGQGVKFICERGEAIGGMEELAAIVTRIHSPTMVSLSVFPCTGELFWRNDLPRRSEARQRNCWDFSDGLADLWQPIDREAKEPPKRRGRPPKVKTEPSAV